MTAAGNKFVISDKLVGRTVELEDLRTIYRQHISPAKNNDDLNDDDNTNYENKNNAKAVYVKGLSGTGKSRLVVEALQSVVESDGGYFCQGKFDQNRSLRPFSALSDALNDLCAKSLSHITASKEAMQTIQDISGVESARTMISMVSNLQHLLPNIEPSSYEDNDDNEEEKRDGRGCPLKQNSHNDFSIASSGTVASGFGDGQHRLSSTLSVQLKIMFRKYVHAIMTNQILVFFIDDLQWADSDSVILMGELVSCLPSQRFLFVGGFRSDEVTEDQYLYHYLNEAVAHDDVPPTMITIQHLNVDDITVLLADTLQLLTTTSTAAANIERVRPLAQLVHEKTQGNTFYVRQFIDSLYQGGHIFYSRQNFQWEWESLSTIHDATATEFSVGDVLSKKILKLPQDTVDALKLAACIGGRFDLDVVEYVNILWCKEHNSSTGDAINHIKMDDVLWNAVEEGLLEEIYGDIMAFSASIQYKFTHDKVQSAAYSLIGDSTQQYHLLVGKYLLQYYRESEDRKWLIVSAADHLFKGESIISSQDERDEYAEVSLWAAKELESNASFKSAAVYCRNAVHFLGEDCFERKYNLSLDVYNMGAMMESCDGNKAASDERIDKILECACCLSDKYTAYYIRIRSCHQISEFDEGCTIAYQLLREMKVTKLPKKLRSLHILYEMMSVFRAVDKLSTEKLLNIATTEDHSVAQYTMFLMQGTLCCLASDPTTLCFFVLRAVRLSLQRGYSTFTPTFFALCGFLRVIITGNFKEADRIGKIGMRLSERFNAPQADVITKYIYNGALQWLFGTSPDFPQLAAEVRDIGFKCGDSGWGCIGGSASVMARIFQGDEQLDTLNAEALGARDDMILYDKLTFLTLIRSARQLILNLLGQSRNPMKLEGDEIANWSEFEAALPSALACRFSLTMQLALAQYFHDIDEGERLVNLSMKNWKGDYPFFNTVVIPAYQCLMLSSLYTCKPKAKYRRQFRTCFSIAAKWRKSGSPIADVLCTLIEALQKSTFERKRPSDEIHVAFREAMFKCKDFGLPSFATIAAERGGMYFATLPEPHHDTSRFFLTTAVTGYQEWHATAKVHDIEGRFSQLLESQSVHAE